MTGAARLPAGAIARRDFKGGVRGLWLLFLCIFLGVATLASIGSLSSAITGEIASRGAILLGGDVEVAMEQRQANAAEIAALRSLGTLSETIRLRSMARTGDGAAILSELKGVDNAYPLYGSLRVSGRAASPLGADEVLVDRGFAERLGVGVGDGVEFGDAQFRIAGLIVEEPDRVGEGFTLGPVAIVSLEGLQRTALVQPGSLFTGKYRLKLPPATSREDVIARLKAQFPQSSWEIRGSDRAAPGTTRFFDRLGQFLTLVGLAAMVIAGIGVGNGVASYLRRKRTSIATLKMLGATSRDIGRIYAIQLGLVALLAILAGLAVGAVVPLVLVALAGDLLPVEPGFGVAMGPLVTSAAFGLLVGLIFAVPPLARSRFEPVASLLRDQLQTKGRVGWRAIAISVTALGGLVALALATSDNPLFAAGVLGAMAAVFLVLAGIGWLVQFLAARVARPSRPLLRLAVAALHRPGSQTIALTVALGLALTLFVALAAVQTSLSAEIQRTIPQRAPSQFVLDIPSDQRDRFAALVTAEAPEARLNMVPTLRGTITEFGGQRVADLEELPDGAWFLRGERGVTYSAVPPEGSDIVAGSWWPPDYRGPPLVSLDLEAAKVLGLRLGDSIVVNVLGREIEARIASFREIHWDSMGFNYIMVFNPSALEAAPHGFAATIEMDPRSEAGVFRAIVMQFPSASVIDVGEIIERLSTILEQMATAIFAAASVAVLAGLAVLTGAIAATRSARIYDSVILKTYGATRSDILVAQGIEYALLAIIVGLFSLAMGLAGAWFVIVGLFDFAWAPDWPIVLGVLVGGAAATLAFALLGSLPVLRARPARALRQL